MLIAERQGEGPFSSGTLLFALHGGGSPIDESFMSPHDRGIVLDR
ncbi:hypothetical protein [Bradyrhizobium sp. USDA 4454]